MATQKNQHYVPQLYLRNFSLDGSSIGLYVKGKDIWTDNAPIKKQSCADYFYGKDLSIENKLAQLENSSSSIFYRLNNGDYNISEADKEILYFYIMLQYGRTEMAARQLYHLSQDFQTKTNNTFPNFDCPTIKMGENLLNSVKASLTLASELYDSITDLSFKILINKTQIDFLTSDNPVCLYNQFCERIRKSSFAFGTVGTQIFFTLNPRLMLLVYDPKCYGVGKQNTSTVEIQKIQDVYSLNNIIFINANKVIYYKNRKNVRIKPYFVNPNRDRIALTHIQNTNNFLCSYLSNTPPLCEAQLSFVRFFSRYSTIKKYYYNMGPLLR